jgi:hypothetical protein
MSSSASVALTVMTDAFFPGQRFQIQRYQAYAGEYLKGPNERHVIVQIRDSAWAERSGSLRSMSVMLLQL